MNPRFRKESGVLFFPYNRTRRRPRPRVPKGRVELMGEWTNAVIERQIVCVTRSASQESIQSKEVKGREFE